jgi:hypothetical protein
VIFFGPTEAHEKPKGQAVNFSLNKWFVKNTLNNETWRIIDKSHYWKCYIYSGSSKIGFPRTWHTGAVKYQVKCKKGPCGPNFAWINKEFFISFHFHFKTDSYPAVPGLILNQWFPTCGTSTTGGTRYYARTLVARGVTR